MFAVAFVVAGLAGLVPTSLASPLSQENLNVAASTFSNPVLWEDLADLDIVRVNSTYYYTASNMHYSPGAPILRSYDLANWEYAGHAIPTLSWAAKYNLSGGQAYVKGTWASTLKYRASNGLYYWIGCIEGSKSYVYTASDVTGPWKQASTINTCFYDCGLFIDDNDTMYVAYGQTNIHVAQLSADGLSVVKDQLVYTSTVGTLEGNHMHKRNGQYYIVNTKPANAEYVLKGSSPFGPFTIKNLVNSITSPVSGSGNPHQGCLIDTQNGDWYYVAFIDNYPGGRTPVVAPITWGSDGYPVVTTAGGAWGASYPNTLPAKAVTPTTGTDSFAGTALGPQWEWNHNPDTTKFAVNDGLTLTAATVTSDLYQARNTLTHRIHGPQGVGTVVIDFTNLADGDRTGLALLRDQSAYVAVVRAGSSYNLVVYNGLTMDTTTWATTSTGKQASSTPITVKKIWLRISADIRPGTGRTATFSYSTDGNSFTNVGPAYTMTNDWHFFMGYRYGIFNFATKALGGSVKVPSFTST